MGDPVIFLFPCFDIQGLKNTRWCGRNQVIVRPSVTFYLDGAHTPRSIEVCLGNRNAAFAHIIYQCSETLMNIVIICCGSNFSLVKTKVIIGNLRCHKDSNKNVKKQYWSV